MSGATEQSEYYWIENRVVPFKNYRKSGRGQWPNISGRLPSQSLRDSLVATIEETSRGFKLDKGAAATEENVAEALMLYRGYPLSNSSPEIGQFLPTSVFQAIEQVVSQAERDVTRQYRWLGDEDRTTGAFFSRIEGTWEEEAWRVVVMFQNYSAKVKEPHLGADAGIIVDLLHPEHGRVLKAAWFQAKRTDTFPVDIKRLPDMAEQLKSMDRITSEGYGLVYTPEGVAISSANRPVRVTPSVFLSEMLRCERGDRSPRVLADTLDNKFVLQVLVSSNGNGSRR